MPGYGGDAVFRIFEKRKPTLEFSLRILGVKKIFFITKARNNENTKEKNIFVLSPPPDVFVINPSWFLPVRIIH
jgi:hypothetical protein